MFVLSILTGCSQVFLQLAQYTPAPSGKATRHIGLNDVLQGGLQDARLMVSCLRPGADDAVASEAGAKDEANGFCFPVQGWEELLGSGRPFRLIRRFVITQSAKKKRCIDNALASQQSLFSSDGNRLQFCSAVQPCLRIQALAKAMHRAGLPPERWLTFALPVRNFVTLIARFP